MLRFTKNFWLERPNDRKILIATKNRVRYEAEAIHYLNFPLWDEAAAPQELFPAVLLKVEHILFSYKFHPKNGKHPTALFRHFEEACFDYFTQAGQPCRRPMFQWVEQKPVEQMIDVWAKNKIEK